LLKSPEANAVAAKKESQLRGYSGCGLAGAAWLAPPQREVAQVTVMLPAATHQELALWAGGIGPIQMDDR
jgi:hypothetical protein